MAAFDADLAFVYQWAIDDEDDDDFVRQAASPQRSRGKKRRRVPVSGRGRRGKKRPTRVADERPPASTTAAAAASSNLFKPGKEHKVATGDNGEEVPDMLRNKHRVMAASEYENAHDMLMRPVETFKVTVLDNILQYAFPSAAASVMNMWRFAFLSTTPQASALAMLAASRSVLVPSKQSKPRPQPVAAAKSLTAAMCEVIDEWMHKEAYEDDLKTVVSTKDKGTTCAVCFDTFHEYQTVSCSTEAAIPHAMCRPCFNGYVTSKLGSSSATLSTITCVSPDCKSVYPPHHLRLILPRYYVRRLEAFEHRQNLQAATVEADVAATVYCPCGVVGTVLKRDLTPTMKNVACAGCHASYCLRCGNNQHDGSACLPPKPTLKWLNKHTKPCPRCKAPIEKNDGCNHMTCTCGHQFCWLCLIDWKRRHSPGHKCPLH